jgi:signal transduction histidine kinase
VIARFADQAAGASCSVDLRAEKTVVGRWDRTRIEQLITNLVSNAVKYGRGKPIAVSVERTLNGARLVVRDEGIGIDPEKLPRIFERFERAASRSFGGLGLGLYIARQIVAAHGGDIRVSSRPGQGTEFTVELPFEGAYEARKEFALGAAPN